MTSFCGSSCNANNGKGAPNTPGTYFRCYFLRSVAFSGSLAGEEQADGPATDPHVPRRQSHPLPEAAGGGLRPRGHHLLHARRRLGEGEDATRNVSEGNQAALLRPLAPRGARREPHDQKRGRIPVEGVRRAALPPPLVLHR
eukprot:549536-Prorocentrum_minimum.AAC.1